VSRGTRTLRSQRSPSQLFFAIAHCKGVCGDWRAWLDDAACFCREHACTALHTHPCSSPPRTLCRMFAHTTALLLTVCMCDAQDALHERHMLSQHFVNFVLSTARRQSDALPSSPSLRRATATTRRVSCSGTRRTSRFVPPPCFKDPHIIECTPLHTHTLRASTFHFL
jgi:hypothetical protein